MSAKSTEQLYKYKYNQTCLQKAPTNCQTGGGAIFLQFNRNVNCGCFRRTSGCKMFVSAYQILICMSNLHLKLHLSDAPIKSPV